MYFSKRLYDTIQSFIFPLLYTINHVPPSISLRFAVHSRSYSSHFNSIHSVSFLLLSQSCESNSSMNVWKLLQMNMAKKKRKKMNYRTFTSTTDPSLSTPQRPNYFFRFIFFLSFSATVEHLQHRWTRKELPIDLLLLSMSTYYYQIFPDISRPRPTFIHIFVTVCSYLPVLIRHPLDTPRKTSTPLVKIAPPCASPPPPLPSSRFN